jgi:hypothetical protein
MHQNGTGHRQSSGVQSSGRRPDRRDAVRHAHAEPVALTTQWGALSGSLMDLSAVGAQVRLADGLVPRQGDDVTLRLLDGRYLIGSIAWADDDALGIKFDHALPVVEDLLWLEQRGPDWFYASVRARQ